MLLSHEIERIVIIKLYNSIGLLLKEKQDGLIFMIKDKEEGALTEIAQLLYETRELNEGENIKMLEDDQHIDDEKVCIKISNGTVVGLSLRFCGLRYLPESLGSLVNLQHLFIHDNNLVALPTSIGRLIFQLTCQLVRVKVLVQEYLCYVEKLSNPSLLGQDHDSYD